MSSISFEILIVLLLILANGVFAMSEMAIVSAKKLRLQQLAEQGDIKARTALELANAPNRFLSTVQIGITLVGIFTGAFGGATLSERLAVILGQIPALRPYSQALSFVGVVLVITYLSLILGELVPKRLALNKPEQIAVNVAIPMQGLSKIAYPVVHLLSQSTEFILRLLGIGPSDEPEVTEEEIKLLIQQGTEAGTFEEVEQEMVERVLLLGDRRVSSIMTPRPGIVWLDLEDSADENKRKLVNSIHSRFPICQGSLDEVLGIIQVNELLSRYLSDGEFDLVSSLHQPLYVPESTRALKILELFQQSGTHIALVVDEYGVLQGLVTLNDIMEAIVGDLPSSAELDDPTAIQREDGSWLVDGTIAIEDFKQRFDIEELPGELRGNYQTLGGFVITYLGHIPKAADCFEWEGFRFEVMDMDGNRVDKVLVVPPSPDIP